MILIVEDNQDDEALTLRELKRNRIAHEIVVARTGEEALDFLFGAGAYAGRDLSANPRAVLLDLNLPKIDGFEVLRRIRADERTKLLPVVVLSSSRQDEDVIDSYALGANSYVRKPVDFADFAAAVKTIGAFWLSLNEEPSRTSAR